MASYRNYILVIGIITAKYFGRTNTVWKVIFIYQSLYPVFYIIILLRTAALYNIIIVDFCCFSVDRNSRYPGLSAFVNV